MKIIILVPIYNDWQSITKLIHEINNLAINQEFQSRVTVQLYYGSLGLAVPGKVRLLINLI